MKRSIFIVLLFSISSYVLAEKVFTYADLISRLWDLEQLAVLPDPGEVCGQWSSYDRASFYDRQKGYVKWYANGDGNGYIRKEGTDLVLAEMEGPGVIWRIWSAMPKEGHLKFYLDGQEKPAIDLPFIGLFDHKNPPFDRDALVHMTARGQNCYIPIPYRESCKIVAQEGWGRYFQFTYTTFPKGTKLPVFKMNLSDDENRALDIANEKLTSVGYAMDIPYDAETEQQTVTIQPGDSFSAEMQGPRAITSFSVGIDCLDREDEIKAMREICLRVYWDHETSPSVWSPIGDFFGTAPGINLYKSYPLGMSKDGMYCNWYMPFSSHARFEFINEGDKPRTLDLKCVHEPLRRPAEELGRFHAKWHRDAFIPKDKNRWPDWTILATEGRGRFCGVNLHIWNPRGGQCPEVKWCKGHYWWGEGDEKFFVDGEKFPSTFGTGTEDYFGYAWGNGELFENCFHNQTISMNNKGHISVNRFQIADNIPFQKSFEGAIEKYFPNHWPTVYDAVCWWYQAPGQADPYETIPVGDRLGYWQEIPVYRVKGAVEGEDLKVISISGGKTQVQNMSDRSQKWSGEEHLWWTGAKPADVLELEINIAKDGKYKLSTVLTKAVDYGIVQVYLDGNEVSKKIDLYNDGVIHTDEINLGTHELKKGAHGLEVRIAGANDKAVKSYMFGMDYIKVEFVD